MGKKMWSRILTAGACLAGLLLGTLGIVATEKDGTYIRKLTVEDNKVSYDIESSFERENVLAVTATYNGEQMCQQQNRRLDLQAGGQTDSQTFSENFESCKVFLVDGTTFMPLCDNAGLETIRFLDYDGRLLKLEQAVYTGQAALTPAAPERDGYLFAGWDGNYETVRGKDDVTAKYVQADADNIFTISGTDAVAGEEITVRVALTGTVQLCGFDMNLFYNDEVLEFVSLDNELSMDVVANHIAGEGRIKFNFSATKDRTKAGNIMDITFRVKECGTRATGLHLEANSVIGMDPEDAERFSNVSYAICEGVIRVL